MEGIYLGLAGLILLFALVIVLGLQIQISSLARRLDEISDRLAK